MFTNQSIKMKITPPLILSSIALILSSQAETILFDLSPPGSGAVPGLSPANEVPSLTGEGSGDAVFSGIRFDTVTGMLEVSVGYGSYAGFIDLTGPATAAHIHGPALPDANAGVVHDFFSNGQHLAAPNPNAGGIISGTISLDATMATDLLAGLYYINIHTTGVTSGELRGQLIVNDNAPPTVDCPDPVVVECESGEGTEVTLVAHIADEDGDALTYFWTVNGEDYPEEAIPSGGDTTEADVELTGVFDLGIHTVELTVSDGQADPVTCDTSVTVEDTMAPVVNRIKTDPKELWPPNHKMVPVEVFLEIEDDCGPVTSEIVHVKSDEAVDAIGSGNTAPDWEVTGDLTLLLRAERAGPQNGRTYTITVESTDRGGNITTSRVLVKVPHDQSNSRKKRQPRRRRR